MALPAGTRLGPYEILSALGAGGMGEVYRARDTRLDRDVAIKVIAADRAASPAALARFDDEARAVAALSHPNILSIFDVGRVNGVAYAVMELLQGESLRDVLARGPLAVARAIDYATQIAHGLAAAHDQGIVHRDLKPGNVFVTRSGVAKILDFGLAKHVSTGDDDEATRLREFGDTGSGGVLGTVGYMAPEQVKGGPVDHRADLFAFGAMLYEMLTGRRAFERETAVETMIAILREPAPEVLRNDVPPSIDRLIHRCLEKQPEARFQSSHDLTLAFEVVSAAPAIAGAPSVGAWLKRRRHAVTFVVLALAAAVTLVVYSRPAPPLTEKDTIVIAEFDNKTGDPVFDGALREGLSAQLDQSPFLNTLSDERIAEGLSLMSQPKDARLTPGLARQVCQRADSTAVLNGAISQIGARYLLTLKAVNCSNGDALASTEVEARDKDHVLDALGKAASNIRGRLGESLSSVRKFDAPPEKVTTPSLDALQAYSAGERMVTKWDVDAAIPLFQRAISLDPGFAMAHAKLGNCYANKFDRARAADSISTAYKLREHTSEREKLYIASHYAMDVTGDLEAARQTYELWRQIYPRDSIPAINVNDVYRNLGQHREALESSQDALRLAPSGQAIFNNLLEDYLHLNKLDEFQKAATETKGVNLSSVHVHRAWYRWYFLQHDALGMQREAALFDEPFIESETAAYTGKFEDARRLARRFIDLVQRTDRKDLVANAAAMSALREALIGNVGLAREQARRAAVLSDDRDAEAKSAMALGFIGESEQAAQLDDDLRRRFAKDTLVRFKYSPSIQAIIAFRRREFTKAIDVLATTVPYELGVDDLDVSYLLEIYLRGEAYLAAHQSDAAAAEFQKIIDHPGVVMNAVTGSLARLQLGRAYSLSGDRKRAKTAYDAFLILWKDADPEIPILKQARAEYANLQ
jgi:hypothetical protein